MRSAIEFVKCRDRGRGQVLRTAIVPQLDRNKASLETRTIVNPDLAPFEPCDQGIHNARCLKAN